MILWYCDVHVKVSSLLSLGLSPPLLSREVEEGESEGEKDCERGSMMSWQSLLVRITHTVVITVKNNVHVQYCAENLPKMLSEFGVCNGTRLKADDFLQNYQLVINITHRCVDAFAS